MSVTRAAALWNKAQAHAQDGLAAFRSEAQATVLDAKAAQASAEVDRDTARGKAAASQASLAQATETIRGLEQQLAAEGATRVALERQLKQAGQNVERLQSALEEAGREFAAELEKHRGSAQLAEERFRAAEERALLEIDRERTQVTKLQKELEQVRASASQTAERHQTDMSALHAEVAQVRDYFQGVILWAGLEEKTKWMKGRKTAEILMHLSRWGDILGISAERMAKATEVEDRKRLIDQEIGSGCCLIVMDNAWDFDLAKRLQLDAPNCAHLITTRDPNVAHRFAPHNFIPVSELSVEDGQKLIAQLAPEAQNRYPQKVEENVQAVGGLPLALILIGNYLRAESLSGQPRHLENAFQQMSLPENRLVLSGQDVSIERPPGFPEDTPVSLAASIVFSEKMLDDRSRQTLEAISLLPPKPNTFPEVAAMAVSGLATPEPIDQLYGRGLLESFKDGRYAMHQTINDFARSRMTSTCSTRTIEAQRRSGGCCHTET